jgi:hypothetical protein
MKLFWPTSARHHDREEQLGSTLIFETFVNAEPEEVLQLCSHPVIGWPDAPFGLFGLRSVQVAAI